jgi:hypothetical protein
LNATAAPRAIVGLRGEGPTSSGFLPASVGAMIGNARSHPPRYPERPDCWHVYYGDVHVGTIASRAGVPVDVDQWAWSCGFYPAMGPGQHQDGTAETFEAARADFEAAWRIILPTRTEADFQAWRDQDAFTAWKNAMHDSGMKLPTQLPSGESRCFCGTPIDIEGVADHIRTAHRAMAVPRAGPDVPPWYRPRSDVPARR